MTRLVHGSEAERNRLHRYGHDVTHRHGKARFSYAQSLALVWFIAGMLAGLFLGVMG